jgi:hypothetical protein
MNTQFQKAPFVARLTDAEIPIFPATIDGEGRASFYTWRPVEDIEKVSGYALARFTLGRKSTF